MVNQRRMEESSATATTHNRRRRGQVPEEESEIELEGNIIPFSISFKPFLATPNLENVRKELEGTKMDPL